MPGMSMSYRVVRRRSEIPVEPGFEVWYTVHEVYFDDQGKPCGVSAIPATPCGHTVAEFCADVEKFRKASELPTLEWDDLVEES